MADITCINNTQRPGVQVFFRPIQANNATLAETVFFGIIWTEKEKIAKEIHILFEEASSFKYSTVSSPEKIFENSLQKLNSLLLKYFSQKEIFNLLFGLQIKDKILFSYFGKIFALLVERKGKDEISVSPLGNLLKAEKEKRIFPKFISGTLNFHQSIFFSTDNISTYFTPLRLGTLLFASSNALWQIKNSLSKLDPCLPFAALHILYKNKEETGALSSMENLLATQARTGQIISPPILPALWPKTQKALQYASNALSILYQSLKPKTKDAGQKMKTFLQRLIQQRQSPKSALSLPAFLKILKKQTNRIPIQRTSINFSPLERVIQFFNRLPLTKKILLLTLLTLIFLFAESLLYLSQTQEIRQNKKLLTDQVSQIENNLTEIKANLIYGDEDKARALFNTTKAGADQLAQNKLIEKEIRKKLFDEINTLEKILRHEIVLQTSPLFEFKEQKRPRNIFKLNNNLYLLSENSLLKYNAKEKKLEVIYQNLSSVFQKAASGPEQQSIFLAAKDKIIEFSIKNKTAAEKQFDLTGLRDLGQYNHRLYLLAGEPLNFTRLTKTTDGFVSAPWLKEKVDLSQAQSLALDGFVYLMNGDGRVMKLLSGRKREFTLEPIEPLLSSPNKILTEEEGDYLYLLEKTKKRLAVFDKKGKFYAQYLAPDNGEIIDFTINEEKKKIYLLTEQGIFEAEMKEWK